MSADGNPVAPIVSPHFVKTPPIFDIRVSAWSEQIGILRAFVIFLRFPMRFCVIIYRLFIDKHGWVCYNEIC